MSYATFEVVAIVTAVVTLLWTFVALGYEDFHAVLRDKRSPSSLSSAQMLTGIQGILWAILLSGILMGYLGPADEGIREKFGFPIEFIALAASVWNLVVLLFWIPVVSRCRWVVYSAIPGAALHCLFWGVAVWNRL